MYMSAVWRIALDEHTLHIPHAALHSSLVADTWFAWQSMPKEIRKWDSKEFATYIDPWYDFCRLHSCRPRCLEIRPSTMMRLNKIQLHPMPTTLLRSTVNCCEIAFKLSLRLPYFLDLKSLLAFFPFVFLGGGSINVHTVSHAFKEKWKSL